MNQRTIELLRETRILLVLAAIPLMNASMLLSTAKAHDDETSAEPEVSVALEVLDESGNLIRFERDIAPIFRDRCLECHGAEESKGDFRIDDPETITDYVEAGDVESSALYTDHLTTDDEDVLMPPQSEGGPLSPGELALIRVWIEEGANWPEDYSLSQASDEPETPVSDAPLTLDQRLWKAIGYLHPATIHLPIALFLLGALFVVVGVKFPSLGTQIPLACLLIGSASAIAATAMGWSLAPTKGYGAGWELLSFERDVDAHRWSGLLVTILACLSSIIALAAFWKDSDRLKMIWKVGLLVCGITIGLVGHQGGEMTYGRDFYPEMFRILLGEPEEGLTEGDHSDEGHTEEGQPGEGETEEDELPVETDEGDPDAEEGTASTESQ